MRNLFSFALFCLASNVFAQGYNFTNYSVEDGLAQSQVNDLAQDKFGNIWFATQGGGLSQYNGEKFTNYTKREGLASNIIYSVAIGHDNEIWVSHEKGISKYNGSSFVNYPLGKGNVRMSLLVSEEGILYFSSHQGGVGAINQDSIYYYNFENDFTDDKVSSIVSGNEGLIYISTFRGGLFTFNGEKFLKVPNTEDKIINSLYFHKPENQLWITTKEGLFYLENGNLHNVTDQIPFSKQFYIRSITFDHKGTLWAATRGGAFSYHPEKGTTEFGNFEGFTNGLVSKVITDREGLIWFTTYGEGVYKYSNALFTYINKQHGMVNEVVMSLMKDDKDHLWMATLGGLAMFDGKEVVNFGTESGLLTNQFGGLATDQKGNIWICTSNMGLYCYVPSQQRFIHYSFKDLGLPPCRFIRVNKDSNGNLWFCSSIGLLKYDGEHFEYKEQEHKMPIWVFTETRDGAKIVGTESGMFFLEDDKLVAYKGISELESGIILTIAQHPSYPNRVYIGVMEEGIIYLNLKSGATEKINIDDNLSSNLIYSLIFDNHDNLLVGTERGIDKISFHENGDILLIKNYNKADGFFGIETNQGAVFKDKDGSIWFGSIRGAFNYKPDEDRINLVPPSTYFTGVKLFYEDIKWIKYAKQVSDWYNVPEDIVLPYNKNHLIFEFMSSSLANQSRVKYQYKLKPFEASWSPVIDKNEAVYSNIPPGEYTFMVKSCNNDGIWNEEPTSLSFIIVAPFWQTWWFITLSLIAIGLALYSIYKYRVNVKLARVYAIEQAKRNESEKVRRLVARDFQDELGNHLASISMFVQVLKTKFREENKDTRGILGKLDDYSNELFSNAKDFVWSLDPNSDSLSETILYIKDLGDEIFDNSQISFIVDGHTREMQNMSLPAGWSRQIVLMLKEAFTAYYKLNKGGILRFSVDLRKDEIHFLLQEQGIGLPLHKLKNCKAYKNILKRAARNNHEVNYQTEARSAALTITGKIPQNG